MTAIFQFDNSYARLPERFFAPTLPALSPSPAWIAVNRALAQDLGLNPDELSGPEGLDILSGRTIAPGSEPIALAYAGHQFGNFVPQLGDGRAILLGELIDNKGIRRDIQLKGAGRTHFSRGGDGKAALGPVLREYLVSEAMAALGIPTTRTLAAVTTGETVLRETFLPGAMLCRVASSHIRVGTFQFFAARGDVEGIRTLADYAIARHYPQAAGATQPYRAMLDAVISAQAALVAQWMLVGFIHGVMNTDNMSIAGETIDYGPCAFMDSYDPATVFSSIDRNGRYAYGNQPHIAHWNLVRLAEAILPLLSDDEAAAIEDAQDALAQFPPQFEAFYHGGMARKLGLSRVDDQTIALVQDLFAAMTRNQVDFTLFFRRLSVLGDQAEGRDTVRALFADPDDCEQWLLRWEERRGREAQDGVAPGIAMRAVNPAYIPRNHRVEAAIKAAVEHQDLAPFEELMLLFSRPYSDQAGREHYADPPEPHERVTATFCGT